MAISRNRLLAGTGYYDDEGSYLSGIVNPTVTADYLGLGDRATRRSDELGVQFVNIQPGEAYNFKPNQVKTGPDGKMYVRQDAWLQKMNQLGVGSDSTWDKIAGFGPLIAAGGIAGAAAAGAGAAGAGAGGAELFGPSAFELGVPGATGYAAPALTQAGGAMSILDLPGVSEWASNLGGLTEGGIDWGAIDAALAEQGVVAGTGPDVLGGGFFDDLITNSKNLYSGGKDIVGTIKNVLGIGGGTQGGLFGGIGDAISLGSRLAPGMFALNYARNQNPLDTTRLDSLYGEVNDISPALLDQYDLETGAGRNRLNTSLTNRGVLGSSFGNMDMTNYSTQRDIGRGLLEGRTAMDSIGLRRNIASDVLNAQVQQRAIQNALYGRAFDIMGRAVSPSRLI